MAKRDREFMPSLENHLKHPHFNFKYVNPFEMMMVAAKTANFDLAATSRPQIKASGQATVASLAPCAHCVNNTYNFFNNANHVRMCTAACVQLSTMKSGM